MSTYTGINKNTGEKVSFSRQWGQKEFTDDECERLANGETISFPYKSPSGRDFSELRGKLIIQEHDGHTFLGFAPAWKYECPPEYCGVIFTEEEKKILESGGHVDRTDFRSLRTGKIFGARVHLEYSTGKPKLEIESFLQENGQPEGAKNPKPTRIKLGGTPLKTNPNSAESKQNTFAENLFAASHNGMTAQEYNESKKNAAVNVPSLTSGKIDVSKAKLEKVIKSHSADQITLLYDNGVLVYITHEDYDFIKDILNLLPLDEVIKEYAFNVDASALADTNKNKNRFEF